MSTTDPTTTDYSIDIPTAAVPSETGAGLLARLGAEALGTFILVLFGVGVALYAGVNSAGPLAVALAFGIAVAAGVAAFGRISGGHFNPAVSLGAAIAGRISFIDVLPYWFAQLIGGSLAGGVLAYLNSTLPALDGQAKKFFSNAANGYGKHSAIAASTGGEGFPLAAALIIETILVAIFVAVILGATDRRAKAGVAPFAIGLTLSATILVAMPFTNASINPARSTATALFSESWALSQLWVFWLAPLVGAAIAALIYRLIAGAPSDEVYELSFDDFGEDVDTDEVEISLVNPSSSAAPVADAAAPAADTATYGVDESQTSK